MARYAIVSNGKIVNIIKATPEWIAAHNPTAVLVPDNAAIGDIQNGDVFDKPPKDFDRIKANFVVTARALLRASDWTQLPDILAPRRIAFETWRTNLRTQMQMTGEQLENEVIAAPPEPLDES